MNPIAGDGPTQPTQPQIQDVAPPPRPMATQTPTEATEGYTGPEIVSGLGVKVQDASSPQSAPVVAATVPSQPVTKNDKSLDGVLKDVNRQIKADDNKPSRVGVFKRWESVIVILVALAVAAALCAAAISAFKK
jgi:hypothetical protein